MMLPKDWNRSQSNIKTQDSMAFNGFYIEIDICEGGFSSTPLQRGNVCQWYWFLTGGSVQK